MECRLEDNLVSQLWEKMSVAMLLSWKGSLKGLHLQGLEMASYQFPKTAMASVLLQYLLYLLSVVAPLYYSKLDHCLHIPIGCLWHIPIHSEYFQILLPFSRYLQAHAQQWHPVQMHGPSPTEPLVRTTRGSAPFEYSMVRSKLVSLKVQQLLFGIYNPTIKQC